MRRVLRSTKGKKPPRYRHTIKENKRLWHIWNGMKRRCLSTIDLRYHEYGGRGIKICDAWVESFDNFADWALSNGYEDDLTIERIDVNGDYCPGNCTWIPRKEQAFNKRDTIWVDYHGRHIQLRKLCYEMNLNYDAINNRIVAHGWDAEKAIDEPISTNEGSLMSACAKLGLNYGTVRDRIAKLGWTREEALGVPTGRGRRGKPIIRGDLNSTCIRCGKPFVKENGVQKFCSAVCREAAKKERRKHGCDFLLSKNTMKHGTYNTKSVDKV